MLLSRGTIFRLACPEELLYADDLALVSDTVEGLKRRLEARKSKLESESLRVNVKIKIIASKLNAGILKFV